MKKDPSAFEAQTKIEQTVAQRQKAQYEESQKIAQKQSSSFNDIFFSIYQWFSKLGEAVAASFVGVGTFTGAAFNTIKSFFTGIFSSADKSNVVSKISYETKSQIQNPHTTAELKAEVVSQQTTLSMKQEILQKRINFLLNASLKRDSEEEEKLSEQKKRIERKFYELIKGKECLITEEALSKTSIPEGIICPITRSIFTDPVTVKLREPDGSYHYTTYERQAIIDRKKWCQDEGLDFVEYGTRPLIIEDDLENMVTDEFKQEQVRQFLAQWSVKSATITPQWRKQTSEAVAEAPRLSHVGSYVPSAVRLGG